MKDPPQSKATLPVSPPVGQALPDETVSESRGAPVGAPSREVAPEAPAGAAGHGLGGGAEVLGDYELLDRLGRGGMGVVYRARQRSADRVVALKVIRPDRLEDLPPERRAEWLGRFRTEGQAAARIAHEHVVTVYEVGDSDGRHFYSMRYVEGRSLSDLLREGPLPGRRAAAYLEPVARGVQAAHDCGILHRDLKPHNILVDAADRPFVTDFGLAKWVDDDAAVTHTGDRLGTPPYMSPEQAQDSTRVTAASDVYSLGATLYAVLTGRPPFQAAGVAETLQQVIDREPVLPRQLNPAIARDLETITLKCLRKEPGRRYPSAAALAEDLRRYLEGEPIQARPVGVWERAVKWARRRPLVATLAGVSTAVTALFVTVLVVSNVRISYEKDRAEGALTERTQALRDLATEQGKTVEALDNRTEALKQEWRTAYLRRIALAQREWEAGNIARAEQLLDECKPDPKTPDPARPDLRGWEWHYLKQLCHADLATPRSSGGNGSVLSRDGRLLATPWTDEIKVLDLTTGKQVRVIKRKYIQDAGAIAFAPDSLRLAGNKDEHTLAVWNARTGAELLTSPSDAVSSIAFSPDGLRLATGGKDGALLLRDAVTGKKVRTLSPTAGLGLAPGGFEVAFSPDGARLAAHTSPMNRWGGHVKIWDTNTGEVLLNLHDARPPLAFSPNGKRLATGTVDDGFKLWDASTGQEVLAFRGHTTRVLGLAFSRDGTRIASTGDLTVRVWDALTGRELRVFRGHSYEVRGVAFGPDGTWLASSGWEVKMWDAAADQRATSLDSYLPGARSWARFSPDGRLIAAVDQEGKVSIWEAATRRVLGSLPRQPAVLNLVVFSPDGKRLAGRSWDGFVKVWDVQSGKELLALAVDPQAYQANVAFSADGKRLAARGTGGALQVWDATTGEALLTLRVPGHAVAGVAYSPDGRHLASGWTDGTVRLWGPLRGEERATLQVYKHRGAPKMAFSPDSRFLASAAGDGVKLWDVTTGKEAPALRRSRETAYDVAYHPDGNRLIVADSNTLTLWDPVSGEAVLTLRDSGRDLAFTPDGTRLITSATASPATIWDATPWEAGKQPFTGLPRIARAPDDRFPIRLTAVTPALAGAEPARAADSLDTIQKAFRLKSVEILGGRYRVGETVYISYELVNVSASDLRIPLSKEFSQPAHVIGANQNWIEHLGDDAKITGIPDSVARTGRKYAWGGGTIDVDPLVPTGKRYQRAGAIKTEGFPPGRYRYTIEYLKDAGGDVIQSEEVEFTLEPR